MSDFVFCLFQCRWLNSSGTKSDAVQWGISHAPRDGHQSGPTPRHHRWMQHPVRAPPSFLGVLYNRSKCSTLQKLSSRIQSHRVRKHVRTSTRQTRNVWKKKNPSSFYEFILLIRKMFILLVNKLDQGPLVAHLFWVSSVLSEHRSNTVHV